MQCSFLKLPELSVLDTEMRIQERETVVLDMFAMFDVKSIMCGLSFVKGYLVLSMSCWIGDAGSRLPYYHGRFGNPHSRSHSYGTCLIDLVMCLSTTFFAFRLVCLSLGSLPHFQSEACKLIKLLAHPHIGWDAEEATEKAEIRFEKHKKWWEPLAQTA